MVRTQEPPGEEQLARVLREAATRHGLKLTVTGWSRRTYDLYAEAEHTRRTTLLVRVESFVATSGEVMLFHVDGEDCAREIGEALELAFGLDDAVIVDRTKG